MKGIILAGGTGSRMSPLTDVTSKHLLPIGNKPMIFHPIKKLIEADIKDIMIITGTEHAGNVFNLLGSGSKFGCKFTYRIQDEAGGIAQALSLCENFSINNSICVLLGDNIFNSDLKKVKKEFEKQLTKSSPCARIMLYEVENPERFGVAKIEGNKIIEIVEKPKDFISNKIVTGIYFYDNYVFDFIKKLEPSDRGEYEITDVNNVYIEKKGLEFNVIDGWWTDAGTFESYKYANERLGESDGNS